MRSIDLFLFYGSTYTYLTVMRIGAIAARAGIAVRWRPINLREIMVEMDNIPFMKKPIKARYMWRDIERRAARHGLPFRFQPVYPVDPQLLATRVGLVAAQQGWCEIYSEATYRAWFLEKKGPGLDNNTETVLAALGKDVTAVIAEANSPATSARLAAETDAARALGIFGSPTFNVDGEIFWGDDRLEEAVDWRLHH